VVQRDGARFATGMKESWYSSTRVNRVSFGLREYYDPCLRKCKGPNILAQSVLEAVKVGGLEHFFCVVVLGGFLTSQSL
jgi:hypothetical protein